MSKLPPQDIPVPPYPGPPLHPNAAAYPPQVPGYHTGPQFADFQYGAAQPQCSQPGPNANVVQQPVTRVVVAERQSYDVPFHMTCPHCCTAGVTRTMHKSGLLTWLICGLLGIFLCWPCCFIPFCVDACKDVEHHCANCNNVIYIHKPM